MGSPNYCYESILTEFILLNTRTKPPYEELNPDTLADKTVEELEETALEFYNKNKLYSIYLMGVSVGEFTTDWQENNDMLNACCGAMCWVEELLGISDNDDEDD